MTHATSLSELRYTKVAIILHWVMAIAFFLMLTSGFTLELWDGMPQQLKFNMYQWHKSLGVLLLIAVFLRIGWRIFHKPPALLGFPRWETIASTLGHVGLYAFMLLMPLTGWFMVSSSVYGLPTIVFGLFEWPHVPDIAGNKDINGLARSLHGLGAYAFALLILGHIAAVIKHAVFDKKPVLYRMLWTRQKD